MKELREGCWAPAASSKENKTGNWRIIKPVISEKCIKCGICTWYCPDCAITIKERAKIDYDYCKGCGICAQVCPQKAITMEK
ncbi:MAG: 4Fe-4S binding protein [Candidatus Aenigmatarchaeota archaeon]